MSLVVNRERNDVTATQLVRDFPDARRLADQGPVRVTSHGRTELVMLTPDHFAQLAAAGTSSVERIEGKIAIILDTIDIAVLIFDEELHVRQCNPAMCQLVDTDEGQLIGLHASALVTHPSHRYIVERLNEVHRSGVAEVLTAASARDTTRTLQISLKPWPGGVALFADDFTDRMRLGDLVAGEDMLEQSLAALDGIGTAHVRSCGTILSGSKGLAQMVGTSASALVGARLQNLLSPESRGVVNSALQRASEGPANYMIQYLKNGVSIASATIVISPYWTAEHHACAAVALHDRDWHST